MLMDALLAIALGIVPVDGDAATTTVHVAPDKFVSDYKQTVGRDGTVHLRGFDRRSGKRYHFHVRKSGYVEGNLGDGVISFRASPKG